MAQGFRRREFRKPEAGRRMPAWGRPGEFPTLEKQEIYNGSMDMVPVVMAQASPADTLEAFGYRVLLAKDGSEALALYAIRSQDIAVVLTDMMMPVMDGPAIIRVLRKINPAVRIIGASGLSANGHAAKAASLGVNHFLPKPYTAETLLKVLN